eukprot:scaffold1696_cov258-Pinguiococcus_pyrenoidosus.AAC.38
MSKPLLLNDAGLALDGNDAVSYFTEDAPVAGSEDYAVEYDGGKYLFSSEENKAAFEEAPEKYAPQVRKAPRRCAAAKSHEPRLLIPVWRLLRHRHERGQGVSGRRQQLPRDG